MLHAKSPPPGGGKKYFKWRAFETIALVQRKKAIAEQKPSVLPSDFARLQSRAAKSVLINFRGSRAQGKLIREERCAALTAAGEKITRRTWASF